MKLVTGFILAAIIAFVSICAVLAVGFASRSAPTITNVYRGGVLFEGPHWTQDENALYWIDVTDQRVYRLDGQTGNVTSHYINYGPVTFAIPVRDNPGLLVVSARTEVYLLPWERAADGDSALRLLSAVDLGLPNNRLNDAKCDANGRLWLGTMGEEVGQEVDLDQATLYMLDENNYANPEVKLRPVSISNGMAWTSDNKLMFFIDSATKNVEVFDYDLPTATIRNRRTFFSFESNNLIGMPDGMTIDKDDNLWVACYNDGKVIKIDSRDGTLLEAYTIPALKVTSLMWGGQDLSTLYVTTRRGQSPTEVEEDPEGGSLFAIEGTGAQGVQEHQFVFPGAATY